MTPCSVEEQDNQPYQQPVLPSSYASSYESSIPSSTIEEDGRLKDMKHGIIDKLKGDKSNKAKPVKGLTPYPMKKPKGYHGYALIINNINIDGREKRSGAENDDVSLAKTLNALGYRLFKGDKHRDKSSFDMKGLISEAAQMDHSDCDSFICCLLSHGDSGKIFGRDDRPLFMEEIKNAFINSPTLIGKPKIFIIQSCRGGRLPNAHSVEIDDHTESGERILLPQECDLFFGYATTPNTKACRFTDIGSWYIIELCKTLTTYHKELDLLSMVQLVHHEIATNPEYVFDRTVREPDGRIVQKSYKQSPQMVSTLIRPLYF
jgi:hypothetical protein